MGIHEIFRVIDCLIKGESAYLFGQLLSEFELNNNVYCQRFNSTTAMFLFSTVKCDHHLTTTCAKAREASSEKASRAFNISFLICAQPTKNGFAAPFGVVCLGTPTRKAAGSNPVGRTKTTNPVKPDWWFFFYCFIPYSQEHPHLLYGPKTSVPIFETSKGSPAALAAGAPFYFAFYTIIARPLAALWCASFLQSHLFAPLQNSHPKTPLDTARFSLSQLN